MQYVVIYVSVTDKISKRKFNTLEAAKEFINKMNNSTLCKKVYPITQEF